MTNRDKARDYGKTAKKALSRVHPTQRAGQLEGWWRSLTTDYPELKEHKAAFLEAAR